MGVFCITALYVHFTLPFLLIRQYAVASAAFAFTSMVVWWAGREFVDWIVLDIKQHRTERRSLFQHSDECAVHPHDHTESVLAHRVEQACLTALHFLQSRQSWDGSWRDFLAPGEGVDWVTAYVGLCLNQSGCAPPEVFNKVTSFLQASCRPSGGWGFRREVPPDSDSTALAVLFLLSRGETRRLESATNFLLEHQHHSAGGFATYANPEPIAEFLQVQQPDSFAGWCSSHICVTAVVAQALFAFCFDPLAPPLKDALEFLRRSQTASGYWESYWWNGRIYATANCMKALALSGIPADRERVQRAHRWLAETQAPDGGWADGTLTESFAFATAWVLRGLLLLPDESTRTLMGKAVSWLLAHQRSDGSWPAVPILRIPEPHVTEPWAQSRWSTDRKRMGIIIPDQNRVFTTATCLSALAEYQRL